jgi:hypothetical protein
MKRYLPTYEDCVKICEENDNLIFFEKKYVIDNYKISCFNYRLADLNHFMNPIKDNININAFELRGITFIFNEDGSLYKRYLLLDKFFNLNQTEISLYDKVKDLEIESIYVKEDGSLITFIKLPNDRIVCKSKMSFDSTQAIHSMELLSSFSARFLS